MVKELFSYSTLLMSPLMTLLYQTDAHLLMMTSPTIQWLGWRGYWLWRLGLPRHFQF